MSSRELPPELLDMFLTTEEVARVLKCSVSTAKVLIREGVIPSVKIGNFRRVPVDELKTRVDDLLRRGAA